ncbi:MAG: Fe-S cluster assembly sulfur transfer protein SufU [Pseudomonadota bacterium]
MNDLQNLYQELIIDHGKNPRNFGELNPHDRQAEGFNPLCGDKLTLYLTLTDDIITEVKFKGAGCAISTASASLMTDAIKGKSITEVQQLFSSFHDMITQGQQTMDLGKLAVLSGVREFPMRVKCATLAWHTLQSALHNAAEIATTE